MYYTVEQACSSCIINHILLYSRCPLIIYYCILGVIEYRQQHGLPGPLSTSMNEENEKEEEESYDPYAELFSDSDNEYGNCIISHLDTCRYLIFISQYLHV